MIRSALLVLVLVATALAPPPAAAQDQRIVAVVNEDIVTSFDVETRIALMMIGAGDRDSPDARQRLRAQVLRQLIDERIQMQEARRLGLTMPRSELDGLLRRIEQNNNLPAGGLERVLRQAGASQTSLERQIEATHSWQRVVNARLRPLIEIGRDEVQEVLRRYTGGEPVQEYLLGEIFLAVDSPDQEDEVRQRFDDILGQLRAGAPFAALAQRYGQGASASEAGDIGWVERGTLDDDVEKALEGAQPGGLAGPVRVAGGYYLYLLREKRTIAAPAPEDARVDLAQIVFPAADPNEREAARALADMVRESVQGCADLERVAREARIAAPQRVSELRVGDLAPDMRTRVLPLGVGETTEVFATDRGIALAMVCVRQEAASNVPGESDIEENLSRLRLETSARRYLRDLRRVAVVDIRA
ncbi:MAG: peptidylprolyl isomerase [Tagaea sp.]|nr:peptidylprolyl isomerase [Tagaea sp.]